jgi:hypothetical protein
MPACNPLYAMGPTKGCHGSWRGLGPDHVSPIKKRLESQKMAAESTTGALLPAELGW